MQQKNVQLLVAIVLIITAIIYIDGTKPKIEQNGQNIGVLEKTLYPKAPEIQGTQGWINSEPLKISDLKGKVVLVDFWTYTCINCIRTLPLATSITLCI